MSTDTVTSKFGSWIRTGITVKNFVESPAKVKLIVTPAGINITNLSLKNVDSGFTFKEQTETIAAQNEKMQALLHREGEYSI